MAEDTFSRKAVTRLPNGEKVERDWTRKEKYDLYCRGFKDGAIGAGPRAGYTGLGPYERGRTDGAEAYRRASMGELARLSFEPGPITRPVEKNEDE